MSATHEPRVMSGATSRGKARRLALLAALALAGAMAAQSDARAAVRSGEQVVQQVCAACHATGKNGAPKIGDDKAWQARAAQGLSSLTEHAIKGIRNMPPHGGSGGVSDFELQLAITYMVNQSGGHWAVPINKAVAPAPERSGEEIVQAQCVKCHGSGVDGAPRIGDRSAWIPRATYGLDALVRSAIRGHGAMPSRGGMPDLTDAEVRRAIVYMMDQGVAAAQAAPAQSAAPAVPPGWDHKVVAGTEIYLGVISAAELRAEHPKPDAQTAVLGRIPRGKDYYHLNVSLFDSRTRAGIKDAQVKATVSDPIMGGETKTLKRMAFNKTVSYGGFFRIPASANPYTVTVRISMPGASQPIKAEFNLPR
ncbi:MAG TPA: c-type cytochrome [Burkholderiales bacterium]|nr:c-type cytochrome [Burkholderiales bacterium]